MPVKCENCVFFDLVVEAGELFKFINPRGDEVSRQHDSNVYICRASPPITGDWPQVSTDDWCGKFQPKEGEA
jgi:hypothetical protein